MIYMLEHKQVQTFQRYSIMKTHLRGIKPRPARRPFLIICAAILMAGLPLQGADDEPLVSYKLGNAGMLTTNAYYGNSKRLRETKTSISGSTLQYLAYTFDKVSNVKFIGNGMYASFTRTNSQLGLARQCSPIMPSETS